MRANQRRYSLCLHWTLSCLLVASVAMAQESVGSSGSAGSESVSPIPLASAVITGQKAPAPGEFRPSPQADPTRIIALVPVVDVPGVSTPDGVTPKAPLFLENRQSPANPASAQRKADPSMAEVPAGIIAFRAMYSDDGQWALLDLQAREASALDSVRESLDARVRIFSASELASPAAAKAVSLPAGLSLALFLEQ